MDDRTPGRKRVILSTSHPDQKCVDIVLYRRSEGYDAGEERLGHVMLCDISPGTPEESEIELTVELEEDGGLEVSAIDRRSGNRRDVSIDRSEAVPRFEEEDAFTAGQVRELLDDDLPSSRRRTGMVWFVAGVILLLLLGGLIWWFFFATPGADATGAENPVPAGTEDAASADGAAPAGETSAADVPSPAADVPPPAADATSSGVATSGAGDADSSGDATAVERYEIKWGDTLWDISSMFYGTPWRFPEIADENMIQNPDLIYADDEIRIPQR